MTNRAKGRQVRPPKEFPSSFELVSRHRRHKSLTRDWMRRAVAQFDEDVSQVPLQYDPFRRDASKEEKRILLEMAVGIFGLDPNRLKELA